MPLLFCLPGNGSQPLFKKNDLCPHMQKISVVIICRNEEDVIGNTIASLNGLTDDVVIYDNGSTDNTIEIAGRAGARVLKGEWEGFGKTKAKANEAAVYDWILSLDADEILDSQLKEELLSISFEDASLVYKIRFRNFLGNKMLKHGEWGNDSHIRIFNRKQVRWNTEAVHETLMMPPNVKVQTIARGFIFHRTMKDVYDYAEKTVRDINTLNRELDELNYEYKTLKSEVMFRSKQSELSKAVEPLGLKEITVPPAVLADSTDD